MKELLVASANMGKIEEIQSMLAELDYQVKSLRDIQCDEDIVEDGLSFLENARIKANYLASIYNGAILADDSGLEVEALDGLPGVHSKRFSSEGTTISNNRLLISKLQGIENRRARFVSCIVFLDEQRREHVFYGFVDGVIVDEAKGDGGFGYDPHFYVPELGKTMAQLSIQEKNSISHRGRAISALIHYLEDLK